MSSIQISKIKKLNKTFDLIGFSHTFLRKWILYQLHGIMTEEKYGSIWTIDHCYPLSKLTYLMKQICLNPVFGINLRPMYSKKIVQKFLELIIHCTYCEKRTLKIF